MEHTKKLIVVIGATGNQGGSVARRFLADPRYSVRGLTRNPSSAASLELARLGAEMVAADLDDVSSLKSAFAGASLLFSVTQYWEPFFRPDCRAQAQALGVTCRRHAYNVEVQQGRNIADAAAAAGVVETLEENGFLVSTLSSARECSGGMLRELYHFDGKADVFPGYVREKHPQLAAKMSCVQTGFFFTSYRILPGAYHYKETDGSYTMRFTTSPSAKIPMVDVNADMGNFVHAVSQMPPGKNYMCAGAHMTWPEYNELWGKTLGVKTAYKQISFDELVATCEDIDLGIEVAHMYDYSSDPGYDGGMDLIWAEDMKKAGLDCPMTSAKEFIEKTDWSSVVSPFRSGSNWQLT